MISLALACVNRNCNGGAFPPTTLPLSFWYGKKTKEKAPTEVVYMARNQNPEIDAN